MSAHIPLTPLPLGTPIPLPSLEVLADCAQAFMGLIEGGQRVALIGDLGTGKTTFTRLLAEALGHTQPVTSPTFGLLHEYLHPEPSGLSLIHLDCYRLAEAGSLALADELEAACERTPNAVVLLEWANYAEHWFAPDWHLNFEAPANGERTLTILPITEGRLWRSLT